MVKTREQVKEYLLLNHQEHLEKWHYKDVIDFIYNEEKKRESGLNKLFK